MSLKLKERERTKACSGSNVLGEEADKCYKLVMVIVKDMSFSVSYSGSGGRLRSGEVLSA